MAVKNPLDEKVLFLRTDEHTFFLFLDMSGSCFELEDPRKKVETSEAGLDTLAFLSLMGLPVALVRTDSKQVN